MVSSQQSAFSVSKGRRSTPANATLAARDGRPTGHFYEFMGESQLQFPRTLSPPQRQAGKIQDRPRPTPGRGRHKSRKAASIWFPTSAITASAWAANSIPRACRPVLAWATSARQPGVPGFLQDQASQFPQIDQTPGGVGMAPALGDLQGLAEKGRHGDLAQSAGCRRSSGQSGRNRPSAQRPLPAVPAVAPADATRSCPRW